MSFKINLTGQRFGKLIVLKYSHKNVKTRKSYWVCLCDCGNTTTVCGVYLTQGDTKSCGCLTVKTHGLSEEPIYDVFIAMKARCFKPNHPSYPNYGGRGITVCERWLKFENFRDDMYESYLKHIEEFGENNTSLDRIEVMGNYEPSNCRWATTKQQGFNKRNSVRSENYREHNKWKTRFGNQVYAVLQLGYGNNDFFANYVGLTKDEFLKYIDSQRHEDMTWDTYGHGKGKWCIDHIIPCCLFDLSKEEDRKKCFNYTNLRPEWFVKNSKKLNEALHG